MVRFTFWLLIAVTLASFPAAGRSQDRPDIALLNNRAVELSLKGDFERAIRIWLRLVDHVGDDHEYGWVFHKNIGRNYQKLGRHAEAWWHLERCLAPTSEDAALVGMWRQEVEEHLTQEHVRVSLEADAPAAAVRIAEGDDATWYKTPLEWWFRPGAHTVLVKARNQDPHKISFHKISFEVTDETNRLTLSLPAEEKLADKPPPVPVSPIPVLPKNGSSDSGVPAWKWFILGGAGALAAGGAVTFHLASSNLNEQQDKHDEWKRKTFPPDGTISPGDEDAVQNDWDNRFEDEVRPLEVTSYVLWGLASATLVTSAILLYPDLFPEESVDQAAEVAPYLAPGGGGINATFSF